MYSLLFHNKWLAALWAGMILLGIYMTTPSEGDPPGAAELARMGTTEAFAERAGVPTETSMRKFEEDIARKEALDSFNSDDGFVDDTDPATGDGF